MTQASVDFDGVQRMVRAGATASPTQFNINLRKRSVVSDGGGQLTSQGSVPASAAMIGFESVDGSMRP
jgi:hypothetical protein